MVEPSNTIINSFEIELFFIEEMDLLFNYFFL